MSIPRSLFKQLFCRRTQLVLLTSEVQVSLPWWPKLPVHTHCLSPFSHTTKLPSRNNLLVGCADWSSYSIRTIVRTIEHPLSPYMLEPFCAELVTIIFFLVHVLFGLGMFQKYWFGFTFSSNQKCGSGTVFSSGLVRYIASNRCFRFLLHLTSISTKIFSCCGTLGVSVSQGYLNLLTLAPMTSVETFY